MPEWMEIAYATDDRFAELACVSMTSVLYNTKRKCRFHVLETRLSDASKEKMLRLGETYKYAEWVFHHIADTAQFSGHTTANLTEEAYLRVLLPGLLPRLDKILYLDCDLIAEGDVAEIWGISLSDKLVAAAGHPDDSRYLNKKEIMGIKPHDIYFNTGVLIMNLQLMRESDFSERVAECLHALYSAYVQANELWFADQEALNYVCKGRVLELPPRMNVLMHNNIIHNDDRLTLEDWADAVRRPLIRHYCVNPKPAFFTRERLTCQDWERYYYYKNMSPYSNSDDVERIRRYREMEAMADAGLQHMRAILDWKLVPTCRAFAVNLKSKLGRKKLAFWGNGEFTQTLMVECAAQGVYADLIVDGLPKNQSARVFHYEVQSPECLCGKGDEYIVVLSTLNRHPGVDRVLAEYGFAPENVLHALAPIVAIKEPL